MGIGGLNPSLSAKENAPAMVRFSFTESEGSRAEAALSPAGRCAKSAGESAAATAKQSRELAFAVGEAGANFASKFESAAAISPSAKENAPAMVRFSFTESEGSRTASVRSVRSVFVNHGLFGLNG